MDRATGDRGALPDPATEPTQAEIQKSKHADYQRTWQTRLTKPEPTDAERLAWREKLTASRPDSALTAPAFRPAG